MKQRSKITRLLALLLTTALLLSACSTPDTGKTTKADETTKASGNNQTTDAPEESTAAPEAEYPEYLNLDSAWPIIKNEHAGQIKLTAAIVVQDEAGEWDTLWISKYFKDKYNIEMEVELVRSSALKDRKQILLNSGELPDLMINMKFTTTELAKYGMKEGLFLTMEEYVNETLTPNLVYYWDRISTISTSTDGHVYSLPKLADTSAERSLSGLNRMFINKKWLDDLKIEMPKTLDEFVSVMYALKDADPAGVGKENFYPLGGGMGTRQTAYFLLNALGYNGKSTYSYGLEPVIRDGEVVVPAYDVEIFQEYLKIMNKFYTDGIVDPDCFTLSAAESDADLVAGKYATYSRDVAASGVKTWNEWAALTPLTSQWQDEPEYYSPMVGTIGGLVISADTEYPELCMRFADMLFNNQTDTCRAILNGLKQEPYIYEGYVLGEWDEEKNTIAMNGLPDGISTTNYIYQYISGAQWGVGAYALTESMAQYAKMFGGEKDAPGDWDLTSSEDWYRASMYENQIPYQTDMTATFPTIYYVDADTSSEMSRLQTVIEPYIKEQVAKFIVGERSLSEVNDFANELKGMGMDTLLEIYKGIYDAYIQK